VVGAMALLEAVGVSSTYSAAAFVVILGLIAILSLRRSKIPSGYVLPPGPWGLPVIGEYYSLLL